MHDDDPQQHIAGEGGSEAQKPEDAREQEQASSKEPHSFTIEKLHATNSVIVMAEKAGIDGLSQIARGVWQGDLGGGDETIRKVAKEFVDAMTATLLGSLSHESDAPPQPRPDRMPATDDDIESWFCDALDDRERCAVRATAILHGAPAHEVNLARDELYDALHSDSEQNTGRPTAPTSSIRTLLSNTFVESRKSDGTSRLFWQDAEANGYSAFGLSILRLIAGEIEGTRGVAGQNILPTLERWATKRPDGVPISERPWRTARALGVIWWTLDHARLRATARNWARSSSVLIQQSASGLLYGAYEIELNETPAGPVTVTGSQQITLDLLRRLSDEALVSSEYSERLARVVTSTYGLIGRKWPDVTLDGLDYLLCLTSTDHREFITDLPFPVFVHGALTYVALAWAGHMRQVLARMAQHVERLIRRPPHASSSEDKNHARLRREQGLAISFFTFFFLAASSLVGANEETPATYSREATLPARPAIPDEHGHDVLLAGILSNSEPLLRANLGSILCGAFIAGKAALASETMRRWAEIVLRLSQPDAPALRLTYLRFLTSVGRLLREWDEEHGLAGTNAGAVRYENKLGHWRGNEDLTELARETLNRLGLHYPH